MSAEEQNEQRVINFVRSPPPPRIVQANAQPHPVKFDVSRTALIVIDMQNDFFHKEGWFGSRGFDSSCLTECIPVINKLTALARESKMPVVWVNWGLRRDGLNLPQGVMDRSDLYGAAHPGYCEEQQVPGRGQVLVKGDWGSKVIDELNIEKGDIFVHKHRMSAFWDNDLDTILRTKDITTLLFAGVNTDRCVMSSLQDASFIGYDCMLVADACGTPSEESITDAVNFLIKRLYGIITNYSDLEKAIKA
ncbi:Isochorismatase-like protein [Dipodascopsis uninucleata]